MTTWDEMWVVRFTNKDGSTYDTRWEEQAQAEFDYTGLRSNAHIESAALYDPTGEVMAEFNRKRTGSGDAELVQGTRLVEAFFVRSVRGLPWEQDDFLHLVYTGALERVVNGEVVSTYGTHTLESARAFAVENGYWASHVRGEKTL